MAALRTAQLGCTASIPRQAKAVDGALSHTVTLSRQRNAYSISRASATTEQATVSVSFTAANVTVTASPGTNIYELAQQSGVDTITVGCCSGNCGVCEVEVRKFEEGSDETVPVVVRSCITPVPPGYARLEVNELLDDIWGVDGFDT